MSNKGYKEIISAAVNDSDIFLSDIPEIDLYIDQIISLIEDKHMTIRGHLRTSS